ncbi:hypothetical protein HK098_008356 [Nowakowskiella sp. JEL0407]|nr:hypothetical protein HK098_008356 [Nowakowskiella sp. JEL0407]
MQTPALKNVIGGVSYSPLEFPNIAYVSIAQTDGKGFLCTGTFIGTHTVLTAAHCVTPEAGTQLRSVTAFSFATSGSKVVMQRHSAANAVPSSSWNPDTLEGDVALIILQNSTPYNGTTIPINVKYNKAQLEGTSVATCGFGSQLNTLVDPDGQSAGIAFNCLPATIKTGCSSLFQANSSLCVDFPPRSTVCHGDSGGPLLMQDARDSNRTLQIGVTSYGQKDCLESGAYFTDIFQYSRQIVNLMCQIGDGNCKNLQALLAKDAPTLNGFTGSTSVSNNSTGNSGPNGKSSKGHKKKIGFASIFLAVLLFSPLAW